jgi:hypothetical protein
VERVRRGLAEAGLDCLCREAANALLDRIGTDEGLITQANALSDARRMRDAIVAVLDLLGELDELEPGEPDLSAFDEISGLFRDISEFATFGAAAVSRVAGADS